MVALQNITVTSDNTGI